MFHKNAYVIDFEKTTQKDMTVDTINISVQADSEKECLSMLDHVLALR